MAFRVILVENEWNFKVQLGNLLLNNMEEEIRIPLADISMIVLDNLRINVSTRMLCQLAENNISLVICNKEHLPLGLYGSYDNHSRMSKKIKLQIRRTEQFYDTLWQEVVRCKINNQARVLRILGKSEMIINNLMTFAENTVEGDVTNREAHAAKIYFNELMGETFSRGNDDIVLNSALDYGYTIIRSYLARLCVGYGLNTQIGIHHKNEYNRFNLCDDLIEPIRPILDLYSCLMMNGETYLTAEHRHRLINFLNHKIKYRNKSMFVSSMLEEYVSMVAAYIEGTVEQVEFPSTEDYMGE